MVPAASACETGNIDYFNLLVIRELLGKVCVRKTLTTVALIKDKQYRKLVIVFAGYFTVCKVEPECTHPNKYNVLQFTIFSL
jgi:hypothetical protein